MHGNAREVMLSADVTTNKRARIYYHMDTQLVAATVCRNTHGVGVVVHRSLIYSQDCAILRHANSTYQLMVFQNFIENMFFHENSAFRKP